MFRQDNTCPVLLFATPPGVAFDYGAITRYGETFQSLRLASTGLMADRAVPLSLAATKGISVDFSSSGYLDVSVHLVRFDTLFGSGADNLHKGGWVSPFGDLRVKASCRLTEAYRRLPRPSSPLTTQASTARACSLDHIISNSLQDTTKPPQDQNIFHDHC